MAVTLEWIRDNYDTIIRDRYIDVAEKIKASDDYFDDKITLEQMTAVDAAHRSSTLLPEYGTTPPPSTETRTDELEEGTHTLVIRLNGYEDFKGKISVNSTSVVCMPQSGYAPCSRTGLPRLETSNWTVTAYMKATGTTTGYSGWVANMGGATGLRRNLVAIGSIIDGYLSDPGDSGYLGFGVSLQNVGATIDYYLGA